MAGVADVDGGFNLVSREHPDFDASLFEEADGFSYLVLQLVLNGSGTHQLQVTLNLGCHFLYHCLSVHQRCLSVLVTLIPTLKQVELYLLLSYHQCAQTLSRITLQVLGSLFKMWRVFVE